jgi:hypothetical protein
MFRQVKNCTAGWFVATSMLIPVELEFNRRMRLITNRWTSLPAKSSVVTSNIPKALLAVTWDTVPSMFRQVKNCTAGWFVATSMLIPVELEFNRRAVISTVDETDHQSMDFTSGKIIGRDIEYTQGLVGSDVGR